MVHIGGGETCNNERAKWFGLFSLLFSFSVFELKPPSCLKESWGKSSEKPLQSVEKCENSARSAETILPLVVALPFSLNMPFPWENKGNSMDSRSEKVFHRRSGKGIHHRGIRP